MTWSADRSERGRRLPADWRRRGGPRERVLDRDGHACQWPVGTGTCGAPAAHVDHKTPGTSGAVGDDELWALCVDHHQRKTASEGGQAIRAAWRARTRRPPRPHPGIITPG